MTALSITDVIARIRDLPPLPAVVADLMNNLGRDDTGARLLADKIAQDQALTAKTLRLANSSFYGMQRKVATIQQAIAIVGFNSVHALVTAVSIIGKFAEAGGSGFDFQAFWRHSLGVAVCAKTLARHAHVNPDHAFIAGLLHDIGRLVLITHSPPAYQQVLDHRRAKDCMLIEAERAVLGSDHARVGRALAEHWKFPAAVQRAIEDHEVPGSPETGSLVPVVHVADAIAHALDLGCQEDHMVPPVSSAVWDSLKLGKEFVLQVFRDTEVQTDEVCRVLLAT